MVAIPSDQDVDYEWQLKLVGSPLDFTPFDPIDNKILSNKLKIMAPKFNHYDVDTIDFEAQRYTRRLPSGGVMNYLIRPDPLHQPPNWPVPIR